MFILANSRSKSEDRVLDGGQTDTTMDGQHDGHRIQAKRNRRSRRLQKKNSLDVQFRRRFSMLRDGNAAANNMYNTSETGGFYGANNGTDFDLTNGIKYLNSFFKVQAKSYMIAFLKV